MSQNWNELRELLDKAAAYQAALALFGWDAETQAPPEGAALTARVVGVMAEEYYALMTGPRVRALAKAAAGEVTESRDRAILRRLSRELDRLEKLPQKEYGAYQQLLAQSPSIWKKAKEQNDGSAPTVLLLRSASTSCKVKNSKGTVLGEILADLGAVNIADSDTGLLEDLSMERIIADDPDYIFVVFQGSDQEAAQKTLDAALTSNPAWDTLSAVQNGNFYIMEKELYHLKPNARWGEAYQKVADILYPAA